MTIPENRRNGLFKQCKRYVDLYLGDNNSNMQTNGEFRLMKYFLPKCDVVFDVGANIGLWTKIALDINKNLKLHAFEPSKPTFENLLKNQLPDNVKCNNIALSSKKGKAKLYIFENISSLNSMYYRKGLESFGLKSQEKEEIIQMETLDNYCKENNIKYIDFLKIDVEGHELEVFKGAKNFLKNGNIKIIQFEYGGCNIDSRILLMDIFTFISDFNYNFYKIYPNRIKHIERYDQKLENFAYQNWLLIRKKHKIPES